MKRLHRLLFWRKMGAALILDVVVAIVLVHLFRSSYEPFRWENVALVVIVLWGLQVVLVAKNSLAELALNHFVEPAGMRAIFLEVLRDNDLPPPSPFYSARFDYLAHIADDESYITTARIKAAGLFATWTALKQARGLVASLMIEKAWDEAIRSYDLETSGQEKGRWFLPAYRSLANADE